MCSPSQALHVSLDARIAAKQFSTVCACMQGYIACEGVLTWGVAWPLVASGAAGPPRTVAACPDRFTSTSVKASTLCVASDAICVFAYDHQPLSEPCPSAPHSIPM